MGVSSGEDVGSVGSTLVVATGLRLNCWSPAVRASCLPECRRIARQDVENATGELPEGDQVGAKTRPGRRNRRVVIVVLEGIQYDWTWLAVEQGGIAPETHGRVRELPPRLAALSAPSNGTGSAFTIRIGTPSRCTASRATPRRSARGSWSVEGQRSSSRSRSAAARRNCSGPDCGRRTVACPGSSGQRANSLDSSLLSGHGP